MATSPLNLPPCFLPYQANRRQWAPLVQHCRTHGGDRSFERTGASLRHGLGVPYKQHQAYLASIGLEPETTAAGWVQLRVDKETPAVLAVAARGRISSLHAAALVHQARSSQATHTVPLQTLVQGVGGRGAWPSAATAGPAARLQYIL